MIIKDNFPNEIELERIKTLKQYEFLYDNRQSSVLDLHEIIKDQYKEYDNSIYVAHAIPYKISSFYSDFVSGDDLLIQINTTGDNREEEETLNNIVQKNNLKERISNFAVDQSQAGFEVLLGYVNSDGEFIIQEVEQDQYFPQSDDEVVFATYERDPFATNTPLKDRDLYVYIQDYQLQNNGDVLIERSVWKTDDDGIAQTKVDPKVVGRGDIQEEEIIEGLGELPVVQIDNGKRTRFGFGRSDYHDIMPQLGEINERITHISTQLLKNLDAKLELQQNNDLINEEGNLKPFDFIMLPNKDTVKTRYVTNENPLIEETFKYIDKQINFISWITGVPVWDLKDKSQPENVENLRIKLFSAVRKTQTKRGKIIKGLKDILRIGFKMLDKELQSSFNISFSSVLPTNELERAKIEQIKVNAGLTSKKEAIKRLNNYTDEEAEQELQRIREEGIQSGAINPNQPPQV